MTSMSILSAFNGRRPYDGGPLRITDTGIPDGQRVSTLTPQNVDAFRDVGQKLIDKGLLDSNNPEAANDTVMDMLKQMDGVADNPVTANDVATFLAVESKFNWDAPRSDTVGEDKAFFDDSGYSATIDGRSVHNSTRNAWYGKVINFGQETYQKFFKP
jgi:hypothetical protein